MPVTITIDSPFAKPEQVQVDENQTVGALLEQFCRDKNTPLKKEYVLHKNGALLDNTKTLLASDVHNEDTITLGSTVVRKDKSNLKKWIIAGLLLAAGIIILIVIVALFASNIYPPYNYGVVFDAGSSHTGMFVYDWEADKWKGTGIITRELASCHIKGGIAQFANNPDRIQGYLEPCLTKANKVVPDDRKPLSPILMGSTAGMRLLKIDNPAGTKRVFDEVVRIFNEETSFLVDPKRVDIIDGVTEGISGWITVNYLYGTFGQEPAYKGSVEDHSRRRKRAIAYTLGAMDMGGASTQVTFEVLPEEKHNLSATDIKTVSMYGKKYEVYSKSYLCYGLTEMEKRYYASLAVESRGTYSPIPSPCDSRDRRFNFTGTFLFDSPCSTVDKPTSYQYANYEFIGTGSYEECSTRISQQFIKRTCSRMFRSECFVPLPTSAQQSGFVAFSGFFGVVVRHMSLGHHPKLKDYVKQMKRICELTPDELQDENRDPFACILSQYIYALLVKGYGFDENTWNEIKFSENVKGHSVGWALGYMVDVTNAIPEEYGFLYITQITFILLLILCLILVIIGAIIALRTYKARQDAKRVGRASPNEIRLVTPEEQA